MKKIKFMFVALVAILGFTACDNDPEHIYDDHSADLVGTWSCFTENYAEVIIINADGTAVSYGVEDGEYWENVSGTVVTKDGNITMIFEDDDNFTGHFDIIPGKSFSLYEDSGERYVYQYCANDLADEIVGMWVCNDGLPGKEKDIAIITYSDNGKMTMTTQAEPSAFIPTDFVEVEVDYKVVGDLKFHIVPNLSTVARMVYTPNGTSFGDILTQTIHILPENSNDLVEISSTFLRVKQSLDLANKNYDYSNIYVTNVKGADKEFEFAGQTLNFSTLDGTVMDKLMKHILFNVSFADNKIYYNCYLNGENKSIDAPIVVEGNKVIIKMSEKNSVYRDIEVYMFQDQDNTQMHMYMPVKSFEKFFGNITAVVLAKNGELNLEDTNAVAQHYAKIEAAIETINVSFVFKAAK